MKVKSSQVSFHAIFSLFMLLSSDFSFFMPYFFCRFLLSRTSFFVPDCVTPLLAQYRHNFRMLHSRGGQTSGKEHNTCRKIPPHNPHKSFLRYSSNHAVCSLCNRSARGRKRKAVLIVACTLSLGTRVP